MSETPQRSKARGWPRSGHAIGEMVLVTFAETKVTRPRVREPAKNHAAKPLIENVGKGQIFAPAKSAFPPSLAVIANLHQDWIQASGGVTR